MTIEYGGFTFANSNSLLVGAASSENSAVIDSVTPLRDSGSHITCFGNTVTFVSTAPGIQNSSAGIDAGLLYAPNGVLLYTSSPDNTLGEIKAGSTSPDIQVDLGGAGIGVDGSYNVGGAAIVPAGFNGAGDIKFTATDNKFHDATLTPDANGNGLYSITNATVGSTLASGTGPEGILYVKGGTPGFSQNSVLIAGYYSGLVTAYTLDANGNPMVSSASTFLDASTAGKSLEGIAVDPLTGDILVDTQAGSGGGSFSDSVFRIAAVPEPTSLALLALGFIAMMINRRKRIGAR